MLVNVNVVGFYWVAGLPRYVLCAFVLQLGESACLRARLSIFFTTSDARGSVELKLRFMKKSLTCTKCRKKFVIQGEAGRSREVPQTVLCPHCQKPNQVIWPMNAGFHVEKPGTENV